MGGFFEVGSGRQFSQENSFVQDGVMNKQIKQVKLNSRNVPFFVVLIDISSCHHSFAEALFKVREILWQMEKEKEKEKECAAHSTLHTHSLF